MHAQQMPMAPHPGIPTLGALGSFASPMGMPHASQAAMLKVPQDLHREDMKIPMGGASVEERLVRINFYEFLLFFHSNCLIFVFFSFV